MSVVTERYLWLYAEHRDALKILAHPGIYRLCDACIAWRCSAGWEKRIMPNAGVCACVCSSNEFDFSPWANYYFIYIQILCSRRIHYGIGCEYSGSNGQRSGRKKERKIIFFCDIWSGAFTLMRCEYARMPGECATSDFDQSYLSRYTRR